MTTKNIHLENSEKESYIIRRYLRFGKFDLNHYKLNENILLVKYPKSRGPVAKIKATPITDTFKNLMHDLIDTQTINTVIQKRLEESEMDLFELLIKKSGLESQLKYKRVKMDSDTLIHRFEILRGQLLAGQNSRIMKDEFIKVIKLLSSSEYLNKISAEDANDLISILNE